MFFQRFVYVLIVLVKILYAFPKSVQSVVICHCILIFVLDSSQFSILVFDVCFLLLRNWRRPVSGPLALLGTLTASVTARGGPPRPGACQGASMRTPTARRAPLPVAYGAPCGSDRIVVVALEPASPDEFVSPSQWPKNRQKSP